MERSEEAELVSPELGELGELQQTRRKWSGGAEQAGEAAGWSSVVWRLLALQS